MTATHSTTPISLEDSRPTATRRPPALLWWGLGLLALFAAVGALIALSPTLPFFQPLDDWWRSVNGVGPDAAIATSPVALFFEYLGRTLSLIPIALVLVIGLAAVGRWRSALFTAAMVPFAYLSQDLTKHLVDRPRPAADEALGLFAPLSGVTDPAFPSGHTSGITTLLLVIAFLIPPSRLIARRIWWVITGLVMIGMMWERTLVNAHWLTDTVFGAILGIAGVLLGAWAFRPWLEADYGRPVWFMKRR